MKLALFTLLMLLTLSSADTIEEGRELPSDERARALLKISSLEENFQAFGDARNRNNKEVNEALVWVLLNNKQAGGALLGCFDVCSPSESALVFLSERFSHLLPPDNKVPLSEYQKAEKKRSKCDRLSVEQLKRCVVKFVEENRVKKRTRFLNWWEENKNRVQYISLGDGRGNNRVVIE